MSLHLWLLYLATITILIMTPGPMVLLTMQHSMHYGIKQSVLTALAGLFASLTLMCISTCGLGALLVASKSAFRCVQIFGALYLFYMGYKAWTNQSTPLIQDEKTSQIAQRLSRGKILKKTLMVGFSNPKDILFFSALFPQFINLHQDTLPQLVILAVTWAIIDFSSMMLYAVTVDKLAPWLRQSGRLKVFNRLSGTAFFSIASVLLATTK